MSVVRRFHPEVRLKTLLAEPGGVTAKTALDRAADNVESVREDCLVAIDVKIEALTEAAKTQDEELLSRVYRLSNEIFAEAGMFGLIELSAAAHSLCTLTSAGASKGKNAAIMVHIEAMRVLRRPDLSNDRVARGAVLAGLRGLTAKLAATA
jgi:phosphoribosylformylglycinamidine (FGAM) synthase PurS component